MLMCPLSLRVNSFLVGIVCWANCMSALFPSVLNYFSATHSKTPGSEARCPGPAPENDTAYVLEACKMCAGLQASLYSLSAALQGATHRAMILSLYYEAEPSSHWASLSSIYGAACNRRSGSILRTKC